MNRQYQILLNIILLSIVIFIAVDIFYSIVREKLRPVDEVRIAAPLVSRVKAPRPPSVNDFRIIIKDSIFGITGKDERLVETDERPVETEQVETLAPTTLNAVLLGTAIGDSQSTIAIIQDPDKKIQNVYKEGDMIQNGVLKKILREKVIIRIGDRDEILMMEIGAKPQGVKSPPALKPKPRVSRRAVNSPERGRPLAGINQLLSQVRIRPHFKNGKPEGLSLTRIKKDSIFAKLGIQNGDILHAINGRPVNKPGEILALQQSLKQDSRISLEITRKGVKKTINYNPE